MAAIMASTTESTSAFDTTDELRTDAAAADGLPFAADAILFKMTHDIGKTNFNIKHPD